jgi:F0F1-type ATP synthase membrane subunit c/vacuolar-type H+-ATPase subunit K
MTIATDYGYLSGEKLKPAVRLKWLRYTWRVLINLFYLAAVSLVFLNIHNSQTQIIVSIGGLLWVAIKTSAIGHGLYSSAVLSAMAKELDAIHQRMKGLPVDPSSYAHSNEVMAYHQTKMLIDSAFMGLIGLLCLLRFFTAL